MDRSSTLTVQINQDHKTEKSNAVSPTTQRQSSVKPSPDAADSNKKAIELHQNQAEIETLEKLTVEQRQLLAKNLSLREQLQQSQQLKQQLLKDLAESKAKIEEYTTVIRNHRMMDLRRGVDDFNRG
ncbi:uncharacterized protein LOC124207211 isoform X2 [Daphnia pulex]|uniref:uncharacterized protein LOC124207211 isoform X2 n=1 Tax=Daphnia pulex TaxID=6669 RepID=UPI001EDDAAED|nr:uncharacterized protein LOC124207211 isoform X2 [Daphnia pulex]